MNRLCLLVLLVPLAACADTTDVLPGDCIEVVLTGTQGGPPAVNGLAGAGTLVRYGTAASHCSDVVMQFDAGRGTTERLSSLGLSPNDLDAVFLTHMHSDHTEGLGGLLQLRWHYFGAPLDVICSDDVVTATPPPERTISCRGFVEHVGDAFVQSGEIAQRIAENDRRDRGGPAALVQLRAVELPLPDRPGTVVWKSGDVKVSAIGTTHIAGSLAFRVDTPAGSVVIGGDAGNSKRAPPRDSSTSETVEALAQGADVLVHSVIHPAFAPGAGSTFPAPVYLRQSAAADLGALAKRAGVAHLLLTHLIPALETSFHGPFAVPGGPLVASDFETAARESGFEGKIYVGKDLLSLRLP
jgi:ribonuclease Z